MLEFFKKIIAYFEANNIPYMLSGSFAMSLYTLPRATRDIDFVVNLQAGDVDGLIDFFKDGYYCSKEAALDAINRQSLFNIIDHRSGFKADFVILKKNIYRQTEFERRLKTDFYGTPVYAVSLEDLLISKLIWIQDWQNAIQMEDIKNLSLIPELQLDYVHYWVNELNLNTFNLL